jgi:hypothetical protein
VTLKSDGLVGHAIGLLDLFMIAGINHSEMFSYEKEDRVVQEAL